MKKLALCVMVAAGLAGGFVAHGQEYSGKSIREVRIEGLEWVSEQLVRSKLEVQAGHTYDARAVSRDIRRLYELGRFSHIAADARLEGAEVVLTYIVEEKRVIDEVKIIGADKVKQRHIRAALTWREGDSFVPEAYEDEREAILKLYRSKGLPNASVDIVVEEIGRSRVRITYVLDEGRRARIKKIAFAGNDTVSRRKLKKVMDTKHAWWFIGGKYDEETFETDLDNIVDEYGNYGRLEAEVARTEFNYADSGKGLNITIYLSEGPEYTVETLETADNEVFDDDEVLRLLKVQAGDVHNTGQVERDRALVQRGYEDSGYVNARTEAQVTLDREKKTTHVTHQVSEGDLKYIREIKITGNSVTRDDVIRREVLTIPGERFDGGLVRASEQRINNLDYFDTVRFLREPADDSELFDNLLVDVEEGKTGYFNFGAGYSTEEKFGGYAELRLNNFDIANWPRFSGGGQQFRLRMHLGDRRTQYYLSFTDPEIAGYPLAFGFDIFDESYDYRGGTHYTEDRTGGQLRFGKMLSPYVTVRTVLRYADTQIRGIPWWAWIIYPEYYGEQREGSTTISSIWGISRNTQDSRRDPTTGARHDLQFELAGLGGDNYFYKLEHDSTWYWALDEEKKWILSFQTREGFADDYGSSDFVPIQDRFFAGGTSTVRGYDSRDIGPKVRGLFGLGDEQTVGGEVRIVENLELKYKLTKQVRLYYFLDAGGVWEDFGDFGVGDIKFGTGLGFGVDIPRMGPIRIDYGIPINPDSDQGSGRLHLLTGFRF